MDIHDFATSTAEALLDEITGLERAEAIERIREALVIAHARGIIDGGGVPELPASKPAALSARQWECLKVIARYQSDYGYPPSLRDIGERMGIKSTNGVNDHLKALERKGYLFREGLRSRAMSITRPRAA